MKLDGYCFLFGLLITPFLFLFFPKLFFNRDYIVPFYIMALSLAVVAFITKNNVEASKPNFYLFLLCPILSLTILRVQLYIFKKALKRNPKVPPRGMVFDDGLGWDRLFYFSFMMLSIVLPISLLAYFYP